MKFGSACFLVLVVIGLVICVLGLFMPESESIGRLNLSGQSWNVLAIHPVSVNDPDEDGLTNCETRTIYLDSKESDYDQGQTLLHEAQHAFTCEDGRVHNQKFNNSDGSNHPGIYFASPKWQQFIRDNPKAVKFIQEGRQD